MGRGGPPLAAELEAVVRAAPMLTRPLQTRHIVRARELQAAARLDDQALARGGPIEVREIDIPSSSHAVTNPLRMLRPAGAALCPGVVFLHGGGMVMGDNRTGLEAALDWVEALGAAVLSPGYRLAPEHPHPTPVEDAYAALCWVADHREALGLDAGLLILAGASAGGGLAAGVTLLARERGGPKLCDLVLMYPMLDDREAFPSSIELEGEGVWDASSNRVGWGALLGERRGGADVPAYAAPSRASDLAGLPAAYVDVGSAEIFRDEAIGYAARLARAGVSVELHVWAGGFHGFDVLAAGTAVARAARETRTGYLRRRLAERTAAG